jgi:hypothetical protein
LAVKPTHQIWIFWTLIEIGSLASVDFGVLVRLRENLPKQFGIHEGIRGGDIIWPTLD